MQISIVEMMSLAPEGIVAVTTLRNKAMNMRVPFEIPAEGITMRKPGMKFMDLFV